MFPIVKVTWHDAAASDNRWTNLEDLIEGHSIVECTTVGFLTKDNKEEVQVVQSLCGEDGGEAMSIPKGCVVQIKKLETGS